MPSLKNYKTAERYAIIKAIKAVMCTSTLWYWITQCIGHYLAMDSFAFGIWLMIYLIRMLVLLKWRVDYNECLNQVTVESVHLLVLAITDNPRGKILLCFCSKCRTVKRWMCHLSHIKHALISHTHMHTHIPSLELLTLFFSPYYSHKLFN